MGFQVTWKIYLHLFLINSFLTYSVKVVMSQSFIWQIRWQLRNWCARKVQSVLFDLIKAFDQSHIRLFSPKRPILLNARATYYELPSNISTMGSCLVIQLRTLHACWYVAIVNITKKQQWEIPFYNRYPVGYEIQDICPDIRYLILVQTVSGTRDE